MSIASLFWILVKVSLKNESVKNFRGAINDDQSLSHWEIFTTQTWKEDEVVKKSTPFFTAIHPSQAASSN